MKKILGVCCIAGIVSLANAFDTGKYICEAEGATYTIELKNNGRYEAIGSMGALGTATTRGEWIDDGNAAIIKEDNKKQKVVLEKIDTGYIYAHIFSCKKEGEIQKNKVENDFRVAPKQEVLEKLINEFMKTRDPNQFKEVCRMLPIAESFVSIEATLDVEQFTKEGKPIDNQNEFIREMVKPLDKVTPAQISNVCNKFALTYGPGMQQTQQAIVQCKVLCEERFKKSLAYAKNVENYKAYKK